MPLDLLLKHAGEYERTHQVVLHVLFSESALPQRLGFPVVVKVGWEHSRGLFDLALEHGKGGTTGVEIKTWSDVREKQADRQRHWARQHNRALAYVLLGCAEFEGVPGDASKNEHHFGADALRSAIVAVAQAPGSSDAVRGLATSYARWLEGHIAYRDSRIATPISEWRRLEYAVFYDRVRRALAWNTSRIYPSNHPGGPVHILNFRGDCEILDDTRAKGARLYWELVDGFPCFKFGPVPERSRHAGALAVRDELRNLAVKAAARHQIDVRLTGRSGEYMSFAKATRDVRTFLHDGVLDEQGVCEYLTRCRDVHIEIAQRWARRRLV
jgi:hypothetical protein